MDQKAVYLSSFESNETTMWHLIHDIVFSWQA